MQIKNVTIEHLYTHKTLVKDLDLVVNNDDKLAIIGEEGNGKSTILKAIINRVDYCKITGTIQNSKRIGYLPQTFSYLDLSVEEYLLSNDGFIDYSKIPIVSKEMKRISFDVSMEMQVNLLSGGERIKLEILKILITEPEILLLDEPTNDLDLDTIEWMENFILDFNGPVVFISHDETLLENVANKILHIEQLKKKNEPKHTVKKIDYATYVEMRKAKIAHQMQVAQGERREHKKQLETFRQVYSRVEHEQNVISRQNPSGARLLAKKMKTLKAQEKRFDEAEFTDIPVVEEAIDIEFQKVSIPSRKEILSLNVSELKVDNKILAKNIEMVVTGPQKIVIVGRNGVGKTTLMKKILTMIKDGLKIGYFPQDYKREMDFDSIAHRWLCEETKQKEDIVRQFMGSMRFTREESTKRIKELSGGQIAKLYILKLILNGSEVLVLDEPTRNFSPLSNPILREALVNYQGVIIAISHDRKFIEEVADVTYELTENGLIEYKK